jgi:hypothetical protein
MESGVADTLCAITISNVRSNPNKAWHTVLFMFSTDSGCLAMNTLHTFKLTAGASLLAACAVLTGCGGTNDEPAPTTSFVATAALGAVTGATCTATEIGSNRIFTALSATNTDGKVVVSGLPLNAGALLLDCSGGAYFDEATGLTKNLAASDKISTVLPKGATEVGVTPLTSLVAASVRQALAAAPAGSTLSNAQINAVAKSVAGVFAPGVDLLAPPTVVKNAADVAAISSNSAAGKYAAALAALSQLAKDQGTDQTQLTAALVSDMADGVIGDDLASIGITNYTDLTGSLNSAASTVTPTVTLPVRVTEDQAVVTPPVVTPPTSGGSGTGG